MKRFIIWAGLAIASAIICYAFGSRINAGLCLVISAVYVAAGFVVYELKGLRKKEYLPVYMGKGNYFTFDGKIFVVYRDGVGEPIPAEHNRSFDRDPGFWVQEFNKINDTKF